MGFDQSECAQGLIYIITKNKCNQEIVAVNNNSDLGRVGTALMYVSLTITLQASNFLALRIRFYICRFHHCSADFTLCRSPQPVLAATLVARQFSDKQ